MGRTRQYTRQVYDYLISAIETNDHLTEKIGDWFGDRWLDISGAFGGVSLAEDMSNVETYHRKLVDKDNLTEHEIRRLFKEAARIDAKYAKDFSVNADALSSIKKGIKSLSDTIGTPVFEKDFQPDQWLAEVLPVKMESFFLYKSYEVTKDLTKLETLVKSVRERYRGKNIREVRQTERDLFVKSYEILYPEKARVLEDFLKPVTAEGSWGEDVQNIKYLAYTSPDPYHGALFKYLPEMRIGNFKRDHSADYGALFDTVNFDISEQLSDPRGGYIIFFHEIGHGIDAEMKKVGAGSSALKEILEEDVRNRILAHLESRFPVPRSQEDDANIKILLDSLLSGGKELEDPSLDILQKEVQAYFKNLFFSAHHDTASDVYGGMTNHGIEGNCRHPWYYWYIHQPSSEYFANAFSRHVTQYQSGLDSINTYFQETPESFRRLFE